MQRDAYARAPGAPPFSRGGGAMMPPPGVSPAQSRAQVKKAALAIGSLLLWMWISSQLIFVMKIAWVRFLTTNVK